MNIMLALMAAVTLATQWKDIPDTNTVGSVLDLGNGPTAVTNAANGAIVKYDETNLTARINAKYAKPNGGIPMSDLASALQATIYGKQDALVSGTNIKTINNQSVLGRGNIVIEGSGSGGGITAKQAGIIATNTVNAKVAPWAMKGQPKPTGSITNVFTNGVSAVTNGSAYVTIPTKTSDLENDSGFLETFEVSEGWRGVRTNVSFEASANAMNGFLVYGSDLEVQEGDLIIHNGWTSLMAVGEEYQTQTLPDYLAGGGWNTAEGNAKFATIGDIGSGGLTTNDVNAIIASSNLCTVSGAKAYADSVGATTVKHSSMWRSMYVMTNEIAFSEYPLTYRPVILHKGGIDLDIGDGQEGGSATNNTGITFNGVGTAHRGAYRLSCDDNGIGFVTKYYRNPIHDYLMSYLVPDGSPVATSNMVERVIASKPAPSPLTGHTYDFNYGSNLNLRIYMALVDVIQKLGGSVTNAIPIQ